MDERHHRNFEYEYVLGRLCDLSWVVPKEKGNTGLVVLDIGTTDSNLLFDLENRGYVPVGLDIRPYHKELPKTASFYKGDIVENKTTKDMIKLNPHFITAISTIEHIGLNCYGGKCVYGADRIAVNNIRKIMNKDTYFIITVPMKYWETNSGRGYTYREFMALIRGLKIIHMNLLGGQICATLVRYY
jgi:hypothetical protein